MDNQAVKKAYSRLAKARKAFEQLVDINDFNRFSEVWTDLLLAGNGVHSVLEQGAKITPQSRQWFGSKKNERRKDELLNYMHQARNADEHGVAPVTHIVNEFSLGVTNRPTYVEHFSIGPDGIELDAHYSDDGAPLPLFVSEPFVVLSEVRDDRFGDVFYPPEKHLGEDIISNDPISTAELWIHYLTALIDEAAKLSRLSSMTKNTS